MTNRKGTKTVMSALCFCAFLIFPAVVATQTTPTETEMFDVIKRATNPTLKLAAAEEFVARFPQSIARPNIAELIANEILTVRDGAVAFALLERAQAIFTTEQERAILNPATLTANVNSGRFEFAFALASEILAKDPENLQVLIQMNQAGTNPSVKSERKLADQALQYGLTAISIIEKGIKPAKISDERWAIHKADLWFCYRNTSILYLAMPEPNLEEAKDLSTKATLLKPLEPFNFAVLGMVFDREYDTQLQVYERMPDGPPKQEARKKLDATLDSIIDAWARAVGLATGRPQHQDLIKMLVPGLTQHYRTRKDSTVGLQQLINKYRVPLY